MLIDCAIYHEGKKVKTITPEELSDYSFKEKEFVWMAFADPTPNEIEPICQKLGVHELALEDVRHGSQMPKMEEYDENIFIVMKPLQVSEEKQENDIYIFAGPNYVITVRKGNVQGFSNIRRRAEKEKKLLTLGPSYVVYAIMDTLVDRYMPAITALECEVDNLEKAMFSDDATVDKSKIIKEFHQAKEKIRSSKMVILPVVEFIGKLFGGRVPEMFEGMDNYFRDVHDHLTRLSTILDSLTETANSGVHTSVALIAIEDSKVTKKLASWAAIFGASTLMAGIWGMNFKNMPELEWKYGYLLALGSIISVALILYRKFKKSRWM